MLIGRPAERARHLDQSAIDLASDRVTPLPGTVQFVTRDGRACLLRRGDGAAFAASEAGVRRINVEPDWGAVRLCQARQVGDRSVALLGESPEGSGLVVRVVDLTTGQVRRFPWHHGWYVAGGRSAEEAVAWEDRAIRLVDLRSGKTTFVDYGFGPCMFRDGRLAYVDGSKRAIGVFDARTGVRLTLRGPRASLGAVAWAPDGLHIIYTCERGLRGISTEVTNVWGVGAVDTRTGKHHSVLPSGPIRGLVAVGRFAGAGFMVTERVPPPELLDAGDPVPRLPQPTHMLSI